MANHQRASHRDDDRPRPAAADGGRDRVHSHVHKAKGPAEREKPRQPRHSDAVRVKKDRNHQRRQPHLVSSAGPLDTSLHLDCLRQPPRSILLGTPIDFSIAVGLVPPGTGKAVGVRRLDVEDLMGSACLVADAGNSERIVLEPGCLSGQKMHDSVHSLPRDTAARVEVDRMGVVPVGYLQFSGLVIRMPGVFRVRMTLSRVSDRGLQVLLAFDSEVVRVHRR